MHEFIDGRENIPLAAYELSLCNFLRNGVLETWLQLADQLVIGHWIILCLAFIPTEGVHLDRSIQVHNEARGLIVFVQSIHFVGHLKFALKRHKVPLIIARSKMLAKLMRNDFKSSTVVVLLIVWTLVIIPSIFILTILRVLVRLVRLPLTFTHR